MLDSCYDVNVTQESGGVQYDNIEIQIVHHLFSIVRAIIYSFDLVL